MSKLQSLYLNGNYIKKIDNLDSLARLEFLNLSNNHITVIENLGRLGNLRKLNLDKNFINKVQGLEFLGKLEELDISQQNLVEGEHLTFEAPSMAGISNSLKRLVANDNKIESLENLWFLSSLETLKLAKNQIIDIAEFEKPLACLSRLKDLDITHNPMTVLPKFRDSLVLMSNGSLESLNNKNILKNEREYLVNLNRLK